jgi:hypothetical protein
VAQAVTSCVRLELRKRRLRQATPPGSGLFRFDRLGIRVPAVVVSPLVERGTLDNEQRQRP